MSSVLKKNSIQEGIAKQKTRDSGVESFRAEHFEDEVDFSFGLLIFLQGLEDLQEGSSKTHHQEVLVGRLSRIHDEEYRGKLIRLPFKGLFVQIRENPVEQIHHEDLGLLFIHHLIVDEHFLHLLQGITQ